MHFVVVVAGNSGRHDRNMRLDCCCDFLSLPGMKFCVFNSIWICYVSHFPSDDGDVCVCSYDDEGRDPDRI